MSRCVLITGVTGFTGRYMTTFLRQMNVDISVIGIDIREENQTGLDFYYKNDMSTVLLEEVLLRHRPHYIIHLAGAMPPAGDELMWTVNIGTTTNLLCELYRLKINPSAVLVIGSAAEYISSREDLISEGHPCCGASTYGRSKWAQTQVALSLGRMYNQNVMVARPFNIIGPGISRNLVVGTLCEQFSGNSDTLEIGNVDSIRDFTDIRDIVRAYWDILTRGSRGEIYNVCSGKGIRISELIEVFKGCSRKAVGIKKSEQRLKTMDVDRSVGNNKKLRSLSGWHAKIALQQSVADMLQVQR